MRVSYFLLPFFMFTLSLNAQTYQGPADGSVSSGITLNTNDFSDSPGMHSSEGIFNIFEYEGEPEFLDWGENSQLKYFNLIDRNENSVDSTILFSDFEGIPQTSSIPPDDYIAAGPDNLMMVVNAEFRIYDKSGNILKTINADQWYGNLVPGVGSFDPKVIYDPIDERWVMVWLATETIQGTNFYLISVSDDSDPAGKWFNWALPSDVNGNTASGNWADYEGVGFDGDAIYLTSNQWNFGGFYDYVKLRIIDKSNIYINSNPAAVTWKDIWSISIPGSSNSAYNLRPSRMYSGSASYYLVYLSSGGGNYCSVFRLINSISNPGLTGSNIQIATFSSPPNAAQLGGAQTIETGGSSMKYEPIFKNGKLYFVHPVKNPVTTNLSGLQFLQVNAEANTLEKDIIMGDNEHFFFYPSLAVDKNNNVIFSYTRSSVNEYAGGYYTILPDSSIPTGSYALKPGNAYYYKDYGSGRNRWGDYSGAWIDPSDSAGFWICTEYVAALNTWGTWVGGVLYSGDVPVELTSFNAFINDNNVELKWSVSTETNNYGYEINRKELSQSAWESIGFVHGKGTTTEKQSYSFEDKNLNTGNYKYRLAQIDFDGTKNIIAETDVNIKAGINNFSLLQNYPNPFNPSTYIDYEVPSGVSSVHIKLAVYDILGNEVKTLVNENKAPGKYDIEFKRNNLTSGVYFYKLTAGNYSAVRKMILLR